MANSFNYDQFESSLHTATESCFQTFMKKKNSQDVCGFALYSDDSASSISASANMQKHLAKVTEEEPDEAIAYKWSPAEWKYESIASKKLDTLSDQLMNVATNISDEAFDTHRAAIFDRCVNVLKKLRQDGLFRNVADNFVLLFDVSDYDDKASQIKWVEALNDAKLVKEFSQLISDEEQSTSALLTHGYNIFLRVLGRQRAVLPPGLLRPRHSPANRLAGAALLTAYSARQAKTSPLCTSGCSGIASDSPTMREDNGSPLRQDCALAGSAQGRAECHLVLQP